MEAALTDLRERKPRPTTSIGMQHLSQATVTNLRLETSPLQIKFLQLFSITSGETYGIHK